MESSEAVPTGKGRNQEAHVLSLCQTTEELKTWNLNEQQQQLVDASGLGNLKYMGDLAMDRTVLRVFCEHWSKETNTARFHDFEMAPSLRDTAYILGIPIIGRAVTTGAVLNMSSEQLFLQYLGRVPGSNDCRGSRVKLSWLRSKFSQLSEHPTDKEIAFKTRAYLLYLIGATLFSEKDKGYVSPKYLPLLSDFEKVREYAWGAAALAHLYKALSTIVSSHSSARKRLFGSATLLMGWIYEYIPVMRPDMEDGPALVIPRVCRRTRRAMSQPAKEASDIKKAFSQLRVSDVNWEPYKGMDPASIPNICSAPDSVCFSRTWLINFNVREVYLPDRFARQFCQEQHPLGDVGGFQRHQWNASVDWSLEYASEIKHFEQLINAARPDHTTVPATGNTTEDVFTPASKFPGFNLLTVVESIKKELPTIARFLEQRSLPVEVATSFARIRELLEDSHLKEGNAGVDARGEGTSELTAPHPPAIPPCEEAIIGRLHGSVPDEAVQNGSDHLAPECCDKPTGEEEDGKAGDVPGTQGEEEASEGSEDSEEDGGHKGRKRPLRRSNRSCVQAKRFKNRGGKGSQAYDPIVL